MAYDFTLLTTKLDKTIEHIKGDLATLRTGRASVQMLDSVQVEAYGGQMRINEVANISVPDPSLIVVAPWDKSLLEAIEKGIATAGLNLNPVVDGDIIRIAVPALTEERRKEMVKLLKQKVEQGRVMIRNVRGDSKQEIEDQKGTDGVSEDDVERDLEQMEQTVKKYLDKLEELSADKEKELMTV